MNKTHLVSITPGGYALVSSHDTEAEAIRAMAAHRVKFRSVCVLRHGATGKRESVAEIEERIRLTELEHSDSIWRRIAA